MVASACQSFSAAASLGPVKMWSGACDDSVYLRLKNTFLDFYTDETKKEQRHALPRSLSADGVVSRNTQSSDDTLRRVISADDAMHKGSHSPTSTCSPRDSAQHGATRDSSTRSPASSTCGGDVESVSPDVAATPPDRPPSPEAADLPGRPAVPSASVPVAGLPVLQLWGEQPSQPEESPSKKSTFFISLANALPAKTAGSEKAQEARSDSLSPEMDYVRKDVLAQTESKSQVRKQRGTVTTTVMIRGIPCALMKSCLMEILDQAGLGGKYDFFYLPMAPSHCKNGNGSNKGNLGYAFVNFVSPVHVAVCRAELDGKMLDPVRSSKVCTISAAEIQGLNSLRRHFRKTAVRHSRHGPVFL